MGLLANNSDGSGKLTCTLSFPPAVQLLANGNGKGKGNDDHGKGNDKDKHH